MFVGVDQQMWIFVVFHFHLRFHDVSLKDISIPYSCWAKACEACTQCTSLKSSYIKSVVKNRDLNLTVTATFATITGNGDNQRKPRHWVLPKHWFTVDSEGIVKVP